VAKDFIEQAPKVQAFQEKGIGICSPRLNQFAIPAKSGKYIKSGNF
jgi:hypothetical protein